MSEQTAICDEAFGWRAAIRPFRPESAARPLAFTFTSTTAGNPRPLSGAPEITWGMIEPRLTAKDLLERYGPDWRRAYRDVASATDTRSPACPTSEGGLAPTER